MTIDLTISYVQGAMITITHTHTHTHIHILLLPKVLFKKINILKGTI